MGFHRHKGGAVDLLRAHQPAGQLCGQRRFALAALAAQHGVALLAQQPLQRQKLAAAADEAGFRDRRQLAEAGRQGSLEIGQRLLRGGGFEQLRVVLFLVEHRHKPIVEA